MSLFSPADIAEFRQMKGELATPDSYRLERKHITATDTRNNRKFSYVVVEGGTCRLRSSGLQPSERVIADRMGWTSPFSVDLDFETLATSEDRIVIGNRIFHIGVVNRENEFAIDATAICEERSH